MDTSANYKTEASVNNLLPIYPDFLMNIIIKTDVKPDNVYVPGVGGELVTKKGDDNTYNGKYFWHIRHYKV